MNEVAVIREPGIVVEESWLAARDEALKNSQLVVNVNNQTDYGRAEVALKVITATSNAAEKRRKLLTDPVNAALKEVKKLADEARQPLEDEKKRLKSQMEDWLAEMERQRREAEEARLMAEMERQRQIEEAERARVEAAAVANPFDDEPESAPLPEPLPDDMFETVAEPTRMMSNHISRWMFDIENPDLVPRAFCSPDERKIREHVQAEKSAASIPGVRVFEKLTVQAR
jgi:hypothetical protein